MQSLRAYDAGELERIKDAYLADHDRNNEIALNDQTWNDMNMDRIFARIDACSSLPGQERLYTMLREPFCSREEIERRDGLIRYFGENEAISAAYSKRLAGIGADIKTPASVTMERLAEIRLQQGIGHILCALLGLFAIAMMFILPTAGLMIFLMVLIINISTYFKRKDELSEYLACFIYIIKAYKAALSMLKVEDDGEKPYRKSLALAVKELAPAVRGSFLITGGRGLTGGVINMILDYLRIFFHLDLIKFNSMAKSVLKHSDDIKSMIISLGEIDAFIAVAAYRRSLPYWCVPEYSEEVCFRAEGLCHPLLEAPVSADIDIAGKSLLITGSNASGKSTFLRSAALSAILGQSIATVYAHSFLSARFRIVSSMTVSDDIASGSSYYMAEIKALKRVIEAAASQYKILCFVDEVLKGTNTVERIAASSEILRSLVRDNVICFAATHDIELTEMLSGYYRNYHFEEDIKQDDVLFSYSLLDGPATTRNAIKLLKIIGYDDAITSNAEKRAEDFEKSGRWKRL